jgi:small subunit ribosomal protein S20
MPIIKSAKKRVKVSTKANIRNVKTRRTLRDTLKDFAKAVQSGKEADIIKTERAAMSAIDQAAKKAVIHRNKAARKKAQVAAQAKAAGAKPAKAPAKKAATPKAKPAAKPTTKKAVAKKPAAKK